MLVNHNVNQDLLGNAILAIESLIKKENLKLHLYKIRKLDLPTRKEIRRIINENPDSQLVLFSDIHPIATFSYKIGAFHFIKEPISHSQVKMLIYKILSNSNQGINQKIIFNSKHKGTITAEISNIAFFQGQGDFVSFKFLDGSSYLDSRRIGEILQKLNNHPYLFKLNKSVVININRVSVIKDDKVYFTDSKVVFELSKNAITELRKRLMWLND